MQILKRILHCLLKVEDNLAVECMIWRALVETIKLNLLNIHFYLQQLANKNAFEAHQKVSRLASASVSDLSARPATDSRRALRASPNILACKLFVSNSSL